jgi:GNAT superfamily N-acetyltransferase
VLDLAKREDQYDLERIWFACFGGPQEYLNFYYRKRFVPSETLVWRENGRPVSMMTLMNVEINGQKGAYVYAVATLPEYRHRGLMRKLDGFAKQIMSQRGCNFSVLVPAERTLFAMYEKLGYHADFFLWEGEIDASGEAIFPVSLCSFSDFCRMRAQFLEKLGSGVVHPLSELRYIYEEIRQFSGEVFRIDAPEPGYAACTFLEDGTLFLRECTVPDVIPAAQAVLTKLNIQHAKVRSPYVFSGSQRIPYGMGRMLSDNRSLRIEFPETLYMSLMLD